jgi:sodium/potassium-transporting ATPase subunit beta
MAIGSDFASVSDSSKVKDRLVIGFRSFGRFLYNSEERTVIGRDGLSWAKISLFYLVFYSGLASLFAAFLGVFYAQLDHKRPTYYADTSLMASRIKINPGLGYRPQIDPEDSLIYYHMNESHETFEHNVHSLQNFMEHNYDSKSNVSLIQDCEKKSTAELSELLSNRSCNFDYKKILKGKLCDPADNFGYKTGPCVALKLNKIFSWLPEPYQNSTFLPEDKGLFELAEKNEEVIRNNVLIHCEGEYSADRDSLRGTNVVYYSSVSAKYNVFKVGLIPTFYFPYTNQDEYRQPLVFAKFRGLPTDTLLNLICRAYASNIDSMDKQMLRGMTKFQLYVKK